MKNIKSFLYTKGKYKKGIINTENRDNEYLYSKGIYPTKIKKEDLSEDYIEFRSKSIWYLTGYMKTSGVVDIEYKSLKTNHLFKDDTLYVSYKEKLKKGELWKGYIDYINCDVKISGSFIIPILLSIEKYSDIDTSKVRKQILEKFNWWKENCPDDYARAFKDEEIDIFEKYRRNEK